MIAAIVPNRNENGQIKTEHSGKNSLWDYTPLGEPRPRKDVPVRSPNNIVDAGETKLLIQSLRPNESFGWQHLRDAFRYE